MDLQSITHSLSPSIYWPDKVMKWSATGTVHMPAHIQHFENRALSSSFLYMPCSKPFHVMLCPQYMENTWVCKPKTRSRSGFTCHHSQWLNERGGSWLFHFYRSGLCRVKSSVPKERSLQPEDTSTYLTIKLLGILGFLSIGISKQLVLDSWPDPQEELGLLLHGGRQGRKCWAGMWNWAPLDIPLLSCSGK